MDVVLEIGLSNAVATAVLAVAAVAITPLCRRRPALVHGLWLLVLLKLLTPPLVRIPLSWPAPPAPMAELAEPPVPEPPAQIASPAAVALLPPPAPSGPSEPASAAASKEPAVLEADLAAPAVEEPAPAAAPLPWREILARGWLVGSCGWLLLAGWRLWRFGRLLAHARPAPRPLQERTAELAGRLGLRRAPAVWLMPGRLAPLLWWLGGRPRLLLPAELPAQISSEGLDTVLLHELAHLRRRDHWVRGLELLAMGLYWWHPVVWYARRELREAEEQCCDAWVVTTLPGAGRLYATTLLDTLDFLSHEGPAVPLLASGLGPVTDLKRRLTMILSGSTPRALGWPGGLALFVVALLCLPCLPAVGQDGPGEEPKPVQEFDPFGGDPDPARRARALESKVRNRQEQLQILQKQLQDLQAQMAREKAEAADKPEAAHELVISLKGDEDEIKKLLPQLKKVLPPSARITHRQSHAKGGYIRIIEPVTDPKTGKQYWVERKRPATALPGVTPPAPGAGNAPTAPEPPRMSPPQAPGGLPRMPTPATSVTPVPPAPGSTAETSPVPAVRPPQPVPPVPDLAPGNTVSDPRIDRLERQMEKILQRLDELQKERGHKPSQASSSPPSPAE